VFLRGPKIVALDVNDRTEQVLGRVPAPDVFSVPARPDRFLLVEARGGGEDFAADPQLSVIDDAGSTRTSFGSGFSPLPDPAGRKVAFLRSTGERVCEGEACFGGTAVFVGDLDGGADPLVPPGNWHLIAWAGDSVILSGAGKTFLAAFGSDLERVPVAPGEVWGATPNGDHLILVRRERVEFLDVSSGETIETTIEGRLAEGAWNPAGTEALAVLVTKGGTRLVRFTTDGAAGVVPDSQGAAGPVLWGPDGSFLFVRAAGLELEAIFCGPDFTCRPILRWTEGITPLALR
jgi:hypothetical protein